MNNVKQICHKHGGQSEFGRLLGVSRQAVHSWIIDDQFPLARVPQISKITGIPMSDLRPDVFGEVA